VKEGKVFVHTPPAATTSPSRKTQRTGNPTTNQDRPEPSTSQVHLFLCGNPDRGDDGAARAVLTLLPQMVWATTDLHLVAGIDPLDLCNMAANEWCVIADAIQGIPAGEVSTFSLADLAASARSLSRHEDIPPVAAPLLPRTSPHPPAVPETPHPQSYVPRCPATRTSTHALALPETLALAEALRGTTSQGFFVGLGGSSFALESRLSPPVAAALASFARTIVFALCCCRQEPRQPPMKFTTALPTQPEHGAQPERTVPGPPFSQSPHNTSPLHVQSPAPQQKSTEETSRTHLNKTTQYSAHKEKNRKGGQ